MKHKTFRQYQRAKLIIVMILLAFFSYTVYYRFAYTDNEKIIRYFQKNESIFIELKDEVVRHPDTAINRDNIRPDLQRKLNIIGIPISKDMYGNLEIGFIVYFNNHLGEVWYWYNEKEIREFADRDGFGLLQINEQWGFEGRTDDRQKIIRK